MEKNLLDFAERILNAGTQVDAWSQTTQFFEGFGFLGCVHGRRVDGRTPSSKDIRFSNRLLGWQDAYMAHKDYERDPLFIYAPDMPITFFTGAAFLEDYPYLQPEDVAVIRRAEAFGITAGIALKMSGEDDPAVRGWNLLSSMTKAEMRAHHSEHGALLHVCAAIADRRISLTDDDRGEDLSPRERDCLLLLAEGLRTEQIAERLGIRPVTVDLHMRNAREKLGARTREQALAVAITQGKLVL